MARVCITNVDDQIFRKFKQLVIAKHGILRGKLGEELTKAMQLWMKSEEKGRKEVYG